MKTLRRKRKAGTGYRWDVFYDGKNPLKTRRGRKLDRFSQKRLREWLLNYARINGEPYLTGIP